MATSLPSNATFKATGSNKDQIYVATTPLRAAKGPPQLLMSAAYSLKLWDLQHYMIIIKSSSVTSSQAIVCDFQPQDPENIYVALAALSGRDIPGTVMVRKISKIPTKRCWYIGSSQVPNAIEAAYQFNSIWNTDLRIGQNDCRHYTNGLAELLTGERHVLEHLNRS